MDSINRFIIRSWFLRLYSNGYVTAYGNDNGYRFNPWYRRRWPDISNWENNIQTSVVLEQKLDFITKDSLLELFWLWYREQKAGLRAIKSGNVQGRSGCKWRSRIHWDCEGNLISLNAYSAEENGTEFFRRKFHTMTTQIYAILLEVFLNTQSSKCKPDSRNRP